MPVDCATLPHAQSTTSHCTRRRQVWSTVNKRQSIFKALCYIHVHANSTGSFCFRHTVETNPQQIQLMKFEPPCIASLASTVVYASNRSSLYRRNCWSHLRMVHSVWQANRHGWPAIPIFFKFKSWGSKNGSPEPYHAKIEESLVVYIR